MRKKKYGWACGLVIVMPHGVSIKARSVTEEIPAAGGTCVGGYLCQCWLFCSVLADQGDEGSSGLLVWRRQEHGHAGGAAGPRHPHLKPRCCCSPLLFSSHHFFSIFFWLSCSVTICYYDQPVVVFKQTVGCNITILCLSWKTLTQTAIKIT